MDYVHILSIEAIPLFHMSLRSLAVGDYIV